MSATAIRILFVSPDKERCRLARTHLNKPPHRLEVVTVASVKSAETNLGQNVFDAVVSDFRLEDGTGLDLIKAIRSQGRLMPFFAFTAEDWAGVSLFSSGLSGIYYVAKMPGPKALYSELGAAIVQVVKQHLGAKLTGERWFKEIFADSEMGMALVSTDQQILQINSYLCDMLGYTEDELQSMNFDDITHPDDRLVAPEVSRRMIEGEAKSVQVEKRYIHKDGHVVWAAATATLIRNDEGRPMFFVSQIRDVTDQKRAAEALRRSETRFRETFEAITEPAMIWRRTPEGFITLDSMNRFLMNQYGGEVTKFIGARAESIPLITPRIIKIMKETFDTGARSSYEMPEPLNVGGQDFWVVLRFARPIENEVLIVATDITRHRASEAQLRKEKEELSTFAHMMAHDLRNSLQRILSFAGSAEMGTGEYSQEITKTVREIEALLASSIVLADAGLAVGKKEKVGLDVLVTEVAKETIPKGVRFEKDALPAVSCDMLKVRQVFQNLLQNAMEHAEPTQVEVRLERSQDGVFVLIRNDGKAVPPEVRAMLFAPGFSTKPGGGRGLAIVKKLVEAHGWSISLDPSATTTFRLKIPLSDL